MKTAEEVLKKYELFNFKEDGLDETHVYFDNAVKAMEEFAGQYSPAYLERLVTDVIEICDAHADSGCFDKEGALANSLRILTHTQVG